MSDLKINNKDIETLKFIYDRMKNKYSENVNVDYMILFKITINKIMSQVNNTKTKPVLDKDDVKKVVCPECGMTPPMTGRFDFEYMGCDACGTKWRG
ncbi:MAG: hypothetical protein ACOCVF_00075 [bacterium]